MILFSLCVCMRVNLVGLEDEQVNQDLEGEGVGSGERRKGELWNEKIYERVPCPELLVSILD